MMNNCTNNFIKRVNGVTRTFKWTVTTNGAAVPLVAEDLTLQLVPPRGEAVSLPFDVDDNVVSFTWQGEDQHIIGCYSLILWANYGEDNQRRVDIHNFVELIPWSDRQSGEYSDLVEETIELETADFGENIMVVDNLNSTSATDALSANMGRQLNVTKQDVIQDLAAIRSGAAAGAAVKEWAKNDPLVTDDATQVSASKLAFNGNIFEQWVPGIASSIGLKGIAGFLKLADISQWDSAYNDRMLPTVAAVKAKLQAVLTALATIEAVIPSQASSTNKLTDKDYVDGAIATNTANFVGTFDTLAELQAVQNPTKNDYGFVIETDAQGNEYYDRYKYTGTQWLYEYKVESTPFTTEQWAAIQSGITAALVSKLSALPTNAELNTALAAKQPVINDLTTIRSGAAAGATAYQKPSDGIPASDMTSAVQTSLGKADAAAPQSTTYTKTEVDAALATKQPVINDLTTIRSGAAAGATAYQKPSGGIPKTDLANAVQTSLGKADAALSRSDMATINGSDISHGGNVTIVAAEGQTITIDAAPTAGSNNAVSSGGVYSAIGDMAKTKSSSFRGSNNTYAEVEVSGLIVGHTYRFYLPSTSWSHVNAVSGNLFVIRYYPPGLTSGRNIIAVTVSEGDNYIRPYYDITIPQNDKFFVGGRADSGVRVAFIYKDITETISMIEEFSGRRISLIGAGNNYVKYNLYNLIVGHQYLISIPDTTWDVSSLSSDLTIFAIGHNDSGTDKSITVVYKGGTVKSGYIFVAEDFDYYWVWIRANSNTEVVMYIQDITSADFAGRNYIGERISIRPLFNVVMLMSWSDFGTPSMSFTQAQGMDVWRDKYLFQAGISSTDRQIHVVDLENRTFVGAFLFNNSTYHLNTLNCGALDNSNDTFPLLYVSESYSPYECSVIKINSGADGYTVKQIIKYNGNNYFVGSSAYDWFIDLDGGYIYAYGRPDSSTSEIQVLKFLLPDPNAGNITFYDEDVIDSFVIPIGAYYQQQKFISGRIFNPVGTGNPMNLYAINPITHSITSIVPLEGLGLGEVEAATVYHNRMLLSNGKASPEYYTIDFS